MWKFTRILLGGQIPKWSLITLVWGNFEPPKICLRKDFNFSHVCPSFHLSVYLLCTYFLDTLNTQSQNCDFSEMIWSKSKRLGQKYYHGTLGPQSQTFQFQFYENNNIQYEFHYTNSTVKWWFCMWWYRISSSYIYGCSKILYPLGFEPLDNQGSLNDYAR